MPSLPARAVGGPNDGPRPGGPFTTPKQRPEIFRADEQEILNEIKVHNWSSISNGMKMSFGVTGELKAFLRNVSKSTLRKGTKIEVKLIAHLLKVRECAEGY
ncbi:hypothetical protein Tco_0652314 [Tanacetum coccineum]|uniref:Uncharacterized protein n=1 Tax=Tanacetum coccineum TaxID=301880 RepID=A0ABQ4WXM3_9ASTR